MGSNHDSLQNRKNSCIRARLNYAEYKKRLARIEEIRELAYCLYMSVGGYHVPMEKSLKLQRKE